MSLRSVIAQVTRGGRSFHLRRHFSSSDASKDAEYRAIKQNILRYFAAVPVGFLAGMERQNGESFVIPLT
ncbi:unnamed protein product [Arabis nemorensis]|uniref:Uncharacterized protein n=1 Tax=Arabis nemorensis TaxID=586526 RepID=A0A565B7N3_9BRAS|nr:unnamed protein product [Arabis nemorensis]